MREAMGRFALFLLIRIGARGDAPYLPLARTLLFYFL